MSSEEDLVDVRVAIKEACEASATCAPAQKEYQGNKFIYILYVFLWTMNHCIPWNEYFCWYDLPPPPSISNIKMLKLFRNCDLHNLWSRGWVYMYMYMYVCIYLYIVYCIL